MPNQKSDAHGQVMRRKLRLPATLLIAAPLLFAALPAIAEETPAAPGTAAEPIISIVSGLAPDDLLNIRATASAIGKTEARLPSGTSVKNYGCNTFNGYPWCKVEDIKNPNLVGWAPARYLTPNNPAPVPEDQLAAPAQQAGAAQAPSSNTPANVPAGQELIASVAPAGANDTAPPADAPAPVDASATSRAPRQPIAPPPDLAARLGGTDHAAPPSIASITGNAMLDAVGMAYVANDNPAAAEGPDPAAPQGEPAEQAAAPDAGDDTGSTAADVPLPTPRPDANAAATGAQTMARLEPKPPQAAWVAAGIDGDIPCARYVGEPMTHCAVKVVRGKDGKADVTVSWPDGGTRLISFDAGKPASSDSRAEFRFTREGELNMIRIGVAERFEITDDLALGD